MAVYLGNAGLVSIQRSAGSSFTSTLDSADVNVAQKRFSFDFPNSTFITGDYLQITRDGGENLDFIAADGFTPSGQAPTGAWYVNVDPLGGIRLFKTFGAAVNGDISEAITLLTPSTSYGITVSVAGAGYKTLGEVRSYEINTERTAIDVTSLGDPFVNLTSGLISGSGQISCFWDFGERNDNEVAMYIHELILRQQIGSNFQAVLNIKQSGASSASTGPRERDTTGLFYLIDALVTNVGLEFTADSVIESQIEFVTTGEIKLRYSDGGSIAGSLLLKEDSGSLDLESGTGRLLQDES